MENNDKYNTAQVPMIDPSAELYIQNDDEPFGLKEPDNLMIYLLMKYLRGFYLENVSLFDVCLLCIGFAK